MAAAFVVSLCRIAAGRQRRPPGRRGNARCRIILTALTIFTVS